MKNRPTGLSELLIDFKHHIEQLHKPDVMESVCCETCKHLKSKTRYPCGQCDENWSMYEQQTESEQLPVEGQVEANTCAGYGSCKGLDRWCACKYDEHFTNEKRRSSYIPNPELVIMHEKRMQWIRETHDPITGKAYPESLSFEEWILK